MMGMSPMGAMGMTMPGMMGPGGPMGMGMPGMNMPPMMSPPPGAPPGRGGFGQSQQGFENANGSSRRSPPAVGASKNEPPIDYDDL